MKRAGIALLTVAVGALALVASAGSWAQSPAAAATPIKAAFYYPWFPETRNANDVYAPSLGPYDSSNRTILAAHVSEAKYGGLDAFISSWWGPGTKTDARLPLLLDAAKAQDFHIAPYYEPEGTTDPTVDKIQQDLVRLKALADQYGDTWLRVNGKPVLFVYNANDLTCAISDKWKQAAPDWYLNLKVFAGYRNCPAQPDSWHQYAPTTALDKQLPYAATVSPGYWLHGTAAPRLARDPARFVQNVADWKATGAQWQLLTTFNEEGEGSAVEPMTQWESPSGFGTYLDILHGVSLAPPPTTTTTTAPTTTVAPTTTTVAPSTTSSVPATTTTVAPPPSTTTPPSGDVRIAAAGDISCPSPDVGAANVCAQGRVSDVILGMNPDAVLTLGDTQYDSGELANLQAFYDPTYGRFKAKTFPAAGNHEYLTAGAAGFKTYFADRLPPDGRTYYSFDVGGWHFDALDSDCSQVGGCGTTSPQYKWLQADLVANDGKPTISYWHHPRWSSGQHGDTASMAPIWNLFVADRDVQIVLNGHDHDYERFARLGTAGPDPAGLREFVVGTGGKNHYCANNHHAGQEVMDCTSYGALNLLLHADGSYEWEFMPAVGTFTDSGTEVHR
jgi:hypothetical protein